MPARYEQAILNTLRATDRPLLMHELVDLIAPGVYEAYGAISNTLTCLYRAGRVARSKSDNSERGKWYEYSYLAEPAQATTADATLVAEMSALRAELLAAKQVICEMLSEFSREMRHVPHEQEQRWRRAAGD